MLKRFLAKWMGRSSRRFGHQSAIRPMRRWRGNGRLCPEGGKTSLRTCERSTLHQQPCEAGCRSGPDIEAPKTPSSTANRPGVDPPKTRTSTARRKPSIDRRKPSIDRRKPSIDRRKPSIDRRKPSIAVSCTSRTWEGYEHYGG